MTTASDATAGARTADEIDREFPHQVETAIMGDRLFAMHAFCVSSSFDVRTRSVRTADGDVTRWCFADRTHAYAFRSRFGGKRLAADVPPK